MQKVTKLPDIPKEVSPLRKAVDLYYDVQDLRLRIQRRIISYLWVDAVRRGEVKEGDSKAQGRFAELAQKIIAGKEPVPEGFEVFVETCRELLASEKKIYRDLQKAVSGHPFYENYLKHVLGIGPVLAAGIIAYGPYSKFGTASKLWKASGLAAQQTPSFLRQVEDPEVRKSLVRYSRRMKRLFFLAAMQFLRTGRRSPYYRMYLKWKAEAQQKHPDWTKGHVHLYALRKVAKLFASHVWTMWWRVMEGQEPPSKPYAIEHLQHQDYYDPKDFMEVPK